MDLTSLTEEMEQAFAAWRAISGEMLQRYSANPYTRSRPKDFAWLVAWTQAKQPQLAEEYLAAVSRFDDAIARFQAATQDDGARVYPREAYQRLCKIMEMRATEDAIRRQRLLEPPRYETDPDSPARKPASRDPVVHRQY